MEERLPRQYEENGINLGEYIAILRKGWWKVALFSLAVGLITLTVMFRQPNIYQATAVITPAVDEKRSNPALGALATFGISVGGPSTAEDLETLFKSNDLTVRIFRKYNLWPIILANTIDSSTGKTKIAWTDSLFGMEKEPKPPGDWDAIRAAKARLTVTVNRKTSTVSISFESPSAEGSAKIVNYYLEEGKSRLQEEALDRAVRNNKFIAEQIGKTGDPLTRDRLYSLYGMEVEREMMARNREQFGFRVIDSPRIPDRKFKPQRSRSAILATVLSFFAGCVFLLLRGRKS
jgi:uncharacterized protein involved in exopolysaccharide biosynthesis